MASELDDNEGNRKKQRVMPAAANADGAPKGIGPGLQGEVTPEIARVVNLLLRLDQLHSRPPESGPPPLPRTHYRQPDKSLSNSSSLSSLSDRSSDRGARRAVPSDPIAFTPPPLPPLRAASDLPAVLQAPLVAGIDANQISPATPVQPQPPNAAVNQSLAKQDRDNPPVVLIGSIIIGLVVLGGFGMYQFQRPPGAPSDQTVTNPPVAPTKADAIANLVPANPVAASGGPCAANLTGTERGVIALAMTDAARAGQTLAISIDDARYSAGFDAKGALRFEAPLLSRQAVVRWDQANGPACEKTVVMPVGPGLLRVALVWSSEAALDLHVIEPNAWFGGPIGHISNLNRNSDQSHGAGQIQAFGDAKASSMRSHVYTIEASRIAPGGVLNAFVKPSASEAKPGTACAGNAASDEQQVQYEVLILRTTAPSGEVQRETRSYAMGIDKCGANGGSDRSERIIVRN